MSDKPRPYGAKPPDEDPTPPSRAVEALPLGEGRRSPSTPEDPSQTPLAATGEPPEDSQPAFVLLRGKTVGEVLPIEGGEWVLGRNDAADLRVDARCVSRQHLKVICTPEGAVSIVDQGSRNGTRVNGERVSICRLSDGDRIELGPDVELLLTRVGRSVADAVAQAREPRLIDLLSPREYEVAGLAVRGMTKAKIATTLGLSARTVGTHVEHIYKKLGIHSRTELARKWYG